MTRAEGIALLLSAFTTPRLDHPGRKGGRPTAPPSYRDPFRDQRERPDEGYVVEHNRGFPIRGYVYPIRTENDR